MPSLNGTGPTGQGPMTGRGMGRCGNGQNAGFGYGQGFGRGYGQGQGRRQFFSNANNLSALEAEEKRLREELDILKKEKEALQKDSQ